MSKPAITFTDEVSSKLQQLGRKAPESLDNVLYGISFAAKQAVIRQMRSTFTERTGRMRKGIQYKRTRRAFFRLRAPSLAAIYEHNGADIKAKGKALRFEVDGQVIFRSSVHIGSRPFFYPGIRGFLASGEINRIAIREIDKELKGIGLIR